MASVRSGSVYELFLPDLFAIDHGLDGRSSATHLSLMGALIVIKFDPLIKIVLQLVNGSEDFSAECDLIKLLQDRFVEALTDAICLRVPRFCSGVFDVVDGQEQLVVVLVSPSAIFGPSVGDKARRTGLYRRQ